MPQFYPSIPENIQPWMLAQPLFFVASAPLHGKHINVSPKVAYLDSTGSGCETISHLYENGRVTLMMNSFGPTPRILRLFAQGDVIEKGSARFEELVAHFTPGEESDSTKEGQVDDFEAIKPDWQSAAFKYGSRAVILLHVFKVQTSCGYGVPKIDNKVQDGHDEASEWIDRDTLPSWAKKKEIEVLKAYRVKNNSRSLDGLPGLRGARRDRREWFGAAETKTMVSRVFLKQGGSVLVGMFLMWCIMVFAKALGFDIAKVQSMGT